MTEAVAAILKRIQLRAPNTVREPATCFMPIVGEGVTRWASGDFYFPMLNVDVQGEGNIVITAYRAQARKMRQLKILGQNNIVFLGAFADASSLDIKILGNDNFIHVGQHSTAGGLRVRLLGDGKTYWLGEDCMLSSRVTLGDPDETSYFDRESGQPIYKDDGLYVGDHCWLGRDSTIRSGARIETHSVVAQGSSVLGRFAPHSIVAGVPAKQLPREAVTWQRLHKPHYNDINIDIEPKYLAFRANQLIELRGYLARIRDDGSLAPPARAAVIPPGALRIQRDSGDILPFRMSRAKQLSSPAYGVLVPQGDLRLTQDLASLVPVEAGALQSARFAVKTPMYAHQLANAEDELATASATLPRELTMKAIALGCVATAAMLGPEKTALSLRRAYPKAFGTNPLTAAIAACQVLRPTGIAVLTTLSEAFNARISSLFGLNKLPLTRLATFNFPDYQQAASLDPASIEHAIIELANTPKTTLVFVLANNIAIPELQVPASVLSLHQLLAWHLCAGAGMSVENPALGVLSGKHLC